MQPQVRWAHFNIYALKFARCGYILNVEQYITLDFVDLVDVYLIIVFL